MCIAFHVSCWLRVRITMLAPSLVLFRVDEFSFLGLAGTVWLVVCFGQLHFIRVNSDQRLFNSDLYFPPSLNWPKLEILHPQCTQSQTLSQSKPSLTNLTKVAIFTTKLYYIMGDQKLGKGLLSRVKPLDSSLDCNPPLGHKLSTNCNWE